MNVQPASQISTPDHLEGTVTFLFTDIEGSTDLLRQLGENYTTLLRAHRQIIRSAISKHQGQEVDTQGDSFFVAFNRLSQAVAAAVLAQRELAEYCGPQDCRLRVRMGLHTGEPLPYDEGYTGLVVHQAARIAAAGHGGQVLLSSASAALIQGELPEGVELRDLGLQRLKDMPCPEHIFQLVIPGLPADFPALHSLKEIIPKFPAFLHLNIEEQRTQPLFVAREQHLAGLRATLEKALRGEGSVAFIAGSPGAGKTALLNEFARRCVQAFPDLLVAGGGCNQYSGVGDAYLPWREILSTLAGDVDARWAGGVIPTQHARRLWSALPDMAEALLKRGPHLFETFLSGEALLSHVAAALPQDERLLGELQDKIELRAKSAEGLEQSHILEQVTGVLLTLAEKHPLLLVLDDLQWADDSSLSLLFHLGRRLEGARILVVGAYRPEEVAMGRQGQRHPLEKVLNEFQRSFGEVCLDLSEVEQAESQQFVQAFLDSEPNRLDENFREALVRHTEGHPLFTIELLRALQRGGDLVQAQDGCWVSGTSLDWEQLPARVEAVIEERIAHLDTQLRQILEVASVEGEDFTARVVASIQEVVESRLLHLLSAELEKRHRLVHETAGIQLENSLLSRYRFAHSLFQRYLYNSLGEGERRLLHHQVAEALEGLFAGHTEEIAEQLAYHYAGNPERERHYCRLAGERAAAHYANAEAKRYFSRALELTPENELEQRFQLHMRRETFLSLMGEPQEQQRELEALQQLAERMDDDDKRIQVHSRQAKHGGRKFNYSSVVTHANQMIRLGKATHNLAAQAEGYYYLGWELYFQGHHNGSTVKFNQAIKLARSAGQKKIEADALRLSGFGLEGQANCEQALQIYRQIGSKDGETSALNNLGSLNITDFGDIPRGITYLEQAFAISQEIGDRHQLGINTNNLAWNYLLIYDFSQAELLIEQGLRIGKETEDWAIEVNGLQNLANKFVLLGDYPNALEFYQQALDIRKKNQSPLGECGIRADISFMYHYMCDNPTAMGWAKEAVDIAREIDDANYQAQAWTALAYASEGCGDLDQAAGYFNKAIDLGEGLKQPWNIAECQAGLARLSLKSQEISQALALVEQVLSSREAALVKITPIPGRKWITVDPFDATGRTFELYLTCYRVLKAAGDPRAGDILRAANTLLMERAERIEDLQIRGSFLMNVRSHRELVEAWELSEDGHLDV